MSLAELKDRPFELLLELERLARLASAARDGGATAADEWTGIGFRIGAEHFVTGRGDVREVLPIPEPLTRVPGSRAWLRGIANVRGQLLTVVDLKAFLGVGGSALDRRSRVLVAASREVPTALIVEEVVGIRRFARSDFKQDVPMPLLGCDRYLDGGFVQGSEVWRRFNLDKLLGDERFLNAGDVAGRK